MYHNTANQSLMGAYPILNQQQLQQNQQRQNGQLNSMIIKEFEYIFKRIEANFNKIKLD